MNNKSLINLLTETISFHKNIKNCINEIDALFNKYGNPSIEIVNYLKDIVQKEALEAWKKNNCRGLIAMATGTGKSRIPINYLDESMKSTILIVPTEKLRDENWAEEFKKVDKLYLYNNIHRECYASLKNIKKHFWRLAILDETHNISELNSTFFDNNTIHQIMALTATVPTDPVKLKILQDLNIPIVYELTLDEAVKLRLVSPYEITIIETELDRDYKYIKSGKYKISEKQAYDNYNKVIDKLEPRVNATIAFEVGYGYQDDSVNRILSEKEKKLLDTMIMKRMKVIYNSYAKLLVGYYLRTFIEKSRERSIYFCGTIEQSEAISKFNYHSKSKNDRNLELFINEKTSILSCVNSLNEGMNIPNVDCAVILQCNSNELHTVQRLGRIIRYREGHVGKIIIIVCKNTVDEKWVNNAIKNLDNTKIRRINFANLKVGNEIL